MATSAGELIYTVDVDTGKAIAELKITINQVGKLKDKMDDASNSGGRLSSALTKVGVAVAAAISVQQLAALQRLSEGFNLLRSRVTRLSEDAATAAQNFDNLVAIANKTGSSVADTVKLWEGLTATLKEFGATSGDVQTLVETLQKIGVVGGSSAEEMSNALRQLGQAISGGTLRAEEFNSIIEQMPELGRQIAAGLGIPFSELRAQMLAGELTSKKVLDAIYNQVDTVNKEFAKMPRTVAQASNALVNSFGDAISRVDKEIGASQNIAKFLDILAKGVEATFSKQIQDRQRFNDLLVERKNLQESINQVERNSPTSTKQLDLMRQRLASLNKELRDMQDAEKKRTIEASKGQEKKDRPDYTKNIKETAKADKEAESAAKKAAKAREQNTDAIADAKLKTEQLRLELANLKDGADEASGATSRYSIESARLAAQQQLNKEATKEQVEALAQQILAQKQITTQIAQQGRLEAQKKEAQGFVKQQAFDAASPLEQIDIEEQAKIAKLEEYRNLELISLQEFETTRNNIIKQAADERAAIELARNSMILSASSDFFGGMADLTGAFAGEQSGAYKALFAISKGFAIANAALQLQTAIANASALPWPANFPAIAQAVALGGQIASGIAGVNYGGAREFGGPVDAGKMYRVGEGGAPEIFQSGGKNFMIPGDGGKVIPNDQIGGGGFSQNVQVHNYSGENVQTRTSMDGKQLEIVIGEVAKQISQRRGGVGRALASSTGTKWKAQ
ncbi:MAG: tape measure protein [Aeromonadaceae bacterium]